MSGLKRQTISPAIVTISIPVRSSLGSVRRSTVKVLGQTSGVDVYGIVKEYEKKIFQHSALQPVKVDPRSCIDMRQIVGLHNCSGMRSPEQIVRMVAKIGDGKDILQDSGLPNIKLVTTEDNDAVLFDGHHTLLAYLLVGRRFLHEVPYLTVSRENGGIYGKDVLAFFGVHAKYISSHCWRNFVINWQARPREQLCIRKENNMGELLDAIQSELVTSAFDDGVA